MKNPVIVLTILFIQSFTLGLVNAQYLVSYENLSSNNNVKSYKLLYNTIDVIGDPTVASGAIYVPEFNCDTFPIISWQHGTTLNRNNVPSNGWYSMYGDYFAENGYIVLLPDYLGLGENMGIHPYLHWESEATASIDLIRAAREFLNISNIFDNNQIFLTGYSQGGHATMAIHKYIQIHDLKDEFNIIASVPMSGPYTLSYDQFDFIFNQNSTNYRGAIFLPIAFASYQMIYGNLYSDFQQYYDAPYDASIESWITEGIIGAIPSNLYSFMQDSVINNIIENEEHPFRMDIRKNDLHNWCPHEPVRMLYCGMDKTVPPQNAITARDTMNFLGAPDVKAIEIDPQGDHTSCISLCMEYALEFFDSLVAKCSTTFIKKNNKPPETRIFPNPTNDLLTIRSTLSGLCSIEIFSSSGRLLFNHNIEGPTLQIDLSSFQKGVYFIMVRSRDHVWTEKIIKL
jgi:hypothetical protein